MIIASGIMGTSIAIIPSRVMNIQADNPKNPHNIPHNIQITLKRAFEKRTPYEIDKLRDESGAAPPAQSKAKIGFLRGGRRHGT